MYFILRGREGTVNQVLPSRNTEHRTQGLRQAAACSLDREPSGSPAHGYRQKPGFAAVGGRGTPLPPGLLHVFHSAWPGRYRESGITPDRATGTGHWELGGGRSSQRATAVPAWAGDGKSSVGPRWCGGLDRAFLVLRVAFSRDGIKGNRQAGRYAGTGGRVQGLEFRD